MKKAYLFLIIVLLFSLTGCRSKRASITRVEVVNVNNLTSKSFIEDNIENATEKNGIINSNYKKEAIKNACQDIENTQSDKYTLKNNKNNIEIYSNSECRKIKSIEKSSVDKVVVDSDDNLVLLVNKQDMSKELLKFDGKKIKSITKFNSNDKITNIDCIKSNVYFVKNNEIYLLNKTNNLTKIKTGTKDRVLSVSTNLRKTNMYVLYQNSNRNVFMIKYIPKDNFKKLDDLHKSRTRNIYFNDNVNQPIDKNGKKMNIDLEIIKKSEKYNLFSNGMICRKTFSKCFVLKDIDDELISRDIKVNTIINNYVVYEIKNSGTYITKFRGASKQEISNKENIVIKQVGDKIILKVNDEKIKRKTLISYTIKDIEMPESDKATEIDNSKDG